MAALPRLLNPEKVLVPVKGERVDGEAFRLACRLTRVAKGKVFALYVIEVRRELPLDAEVSEETARGESVLGEIEAVAGEEKCQVEAEILQAREAGPAIVQEAAEREVELIVVGLPYKRHLGTFTMGEVIPYILKNAPCPVIVWREAIPERGH
jgi:nucleotide-binding universal stress UspA family protein